jgi:3-hydroxyisobutyrate dehydrogenase-like beta-hydroxyacid dehydrogenase
MQLAGEDRTMNHALPSVCVIGLGLMGRPMARVLHDAGFSVSGWNRSPVDDAVREWLPLATGLEAAAQADVCLLMLAHSDAVDAVLAELEPLLVPGRLVLDMGSSDPRRSRAHAQRLTERGIGWVDAPVSGGPEGARTGTLAIMAGASEADFRTVLPLLEALGAAVTRVGPAGAGHTAKAINQLIVGLTIEAVAEAIALAEGCGLDPRLLQRALGGGFADSKILQIHGTRMIARDYRPGGKVSTQLKDLTLARALADDCGLSLPHLDSTLARYQSLVDAGAADLDHSALAKLLQD